MTNQPMLLAFLQELFKRFATKSPTFFRIWQIVFAVVSAATGIPELLQWFGVDLPPQLDFLANKVIATASTVGYLMAALTTQSTTVGVTHEGEVVKKTNEVRLPFTAATEAKAAAKMPNAPKVVVSGKDDPAEDA